MTRPHPKPVFVQLPQPQLTVQLSCLIADDEPLAHQLLENYIGRLKMLYVAGNAYSAFEVLDFLGSNKVDLMFLDIQMPDLSGLDMLKTLTQPPLVILTTAYSEYSLEAFDLGVTDYLLKPIKFERFLKAVNRVIDIRKGALQYQPAHSQSLPVTAPPDFIFLKDGMVEYKVLLYEILYVQAYGNFAKVHTHEHTFVATITMKQLEDMLPETNFIRVHKSYIIRVDKMTKMEKEQVFIDKTAIPVGTMYKLLLEKRVRLTPLNHIP